MLVGTPLREIVVSCESDTYKHHTCTIYMKSDKKFCLHLWGMCIGINVYARSAVNVCFAIRVGFTFMKEFDQ